MIPENRPDSAEWFNQIPILVMSACWLGPLGIFWLIVWGPLRPFRYEPGSVGPSLWVFLLALGLGILATRVSAGYFRLRAFETSGHLYETLGVRLFRRLVPDGEVSNRLRRRRRPRFRVISNRQDARAFLERTEASERGHLVLLLPGFVSSAYAVHIGWFGWAVVLGVGNIVVNAYPIILQRYTRGRILRALRARERGVLPPP